MLLCKPLSCMNLTAVAVSLPPSNAYAINSVPLQWLTMNMTSYACNLNLIKVIMLCCDCYHSTSCYATHRFYTVKHTCTTEAPQPPACYQCHIQPHAITYCNIVTLYEAPQHSIDTKLPYITHNSAHLLTVVHPASAAVLQRLRCVNTSALNSWLMQLQSIPHQANLVLAM